MKISRFLYYFIWFILITLVSCQSVTSHALPTKDRENTFTPTIIKKIASTPIPSQTVGLDTAFPATLSITQTKSITPSLPAVKVTDTPIPLPTVSPTFDLYAIKTATLAPADVCPPVLSKPTEIPNIENSFNANVELLDFLNQYGADPLVKDRTQKLNAVYRDLTNDGVPELALELRKFLVLGCKEGTYRFLFSLDPNRYDRAPEIVAIQDNNKNGIPELYMLIDQGTLGTYYYQIYEWNGEKFSELVIGLIEVDGNGKLTFEDEDQDGMQEVVANNKVPYGTNIWYQGLPLRNVKSYYHWDGFCFQYYKHLYASPQYRFQAVQDGDRASQQGEYEKALDLYQQAIFSDQLDWWSIEKRVGLRETRVGEPTPTFLSPDSLEYTNLAAYSRYRIMLLHLSRGYQSDAKVVYETLQTKYPQGKPGRVYAEMATAFWSEYEISSNLATSCTKALDYVKQHIDNIVTYIGDTDYHGDETIHYRDNLEMLCPFH